MITITAPIQNQFYQRDSQNNANIKLTGSTDLPSKLVIKLADKIIYQQDLTGNFDVIKTFKQGIYKAEFSINNLVKETVNFEVGRVFLCTGHSFAEGIGSGLITSENVFFQSNIEGAVPAISMFTENPIYKKIIDYAVTDNSNSKNSGIWSQLAENLSKKDNSPILFYHSSWGGTSIKQWAEASSGLNPSGYAGYNSSNPLNCPYYKTKNILKSLIKNTGIEAVLIMHGENDTNDTKENIVNNYKTVINAMRNDANIPDLPIYISRSTWRSDGEKKVIKAQNEVIETTANVYAGPDLTQIGDDGRKVINYFAPASNDEHLNAVGEKQAAKLWSEAIKDYHNKNVVENFMDTLKPLIGGSIASAKSSSLIGAIVVFIALFLINRLLKFGVFGFVGVLLVSIGVYLSNIFNSETNESTN